MNDPRPLLIFPAGIVALSMALAVAHPIAVIVRALLLLTGGDGS
jgi:hypothetical protein